MKKYKWIENRENVNNIVHILVIKETNETIATINENNWCDYSLWNKNYTTFTRCRNELKTVKRMAEKSRGIKPEEVEE